MDVTTEDRAFAPLLFLDDHQSVPVVRKQSRSLSHSKDQSPLLAFMQLSHWAQCERILLLFLYVNGCDERGDAAVLSWPEYKPRERTEFSLCCMWASTYAFN